MEVSDFLCIFADGYAWDYNLKLSFRAAICDADNKGKMSAENKDMLLKRVSLEWEDEKALHQQQFRETTELLVNYLAEIR